LPDCLDDWIEESNPVRAVDAFVGALDPGMLGFEGLVPEATGWPSYHRLEREAGRNLEVIWLLRRLTPVDWAWR
jgi:hypothetical protein